jgi:hypothetical protein
MERQISSVSLSSRPHASNHTAPKVLDALPKQVERYRATLTLAESRYKNHYSRSGGLTTKVTRTAARTRRPTRTACPQWGPLAGETSAAFLFEPQRVRLRGGIT